MNNALSVESFPPATMRILDANANRAAEGMRTMEETARFVLDASALTSELKMLRHDLATAMQRIPRAELLRYRDTPGDVGTTVTTPSENRRDGVAEIVAAASSRTQQSLRCLEEYGKSIDGRFALDVEQIRYRGYDLFSRTERECLASKNVVRFTEPKTLESTNRRIPRLHQARLYALIDAQSDEEKFATRIRSLANAGVDVIQLRDRNVDDRTLYERAVIGTSIAHEVGVLWIINDRADIAAAALADGVHVGQEELPVDRVREIVGPDAIIGLSTHCISQVDEAIESAADYIGCGPVFPGSTKRFDAFPGCAFLNEVSSRWNQPGATPRVLPAFAIGGITPANVHEVTAAGFGRIAVTEALNQKEAINSNRLREALSVVELETDADCEVVSRSSEEHA